MIFNKQSLRNAFLKLENKNLIYSKETYDLYLQQAKIDRTGSVDDQDKSLAKQSGLLAEHFECPVHNHEEAIKKLTHLDLSKKDTVAPGAIIKINNKYFFVGIASGSVIFEQEKFIGLSTNAPIYQEIEGLSKGDGFVFNGKELKVDDVQ